MSPNLHSQLIAGLRELEFTLTPYQQTQLLTYIELLSTWNKTYNLTAIRNQQDMISGHLLDSLSAMPYVVGDRIIDLGTGAGLPGIPLAIAKPDQQFVLLDSLQKRTRFLSHVIHQLKLTNINIVCDRIENYQADHVFDTLLARALAKCAPLISDSIHLCKPGGHWVLLKSHNPEAECQTLPENTQLLSIHPTRVPGLNQTRHLVIVGKETL